MLESNTTAEGNRFAEWLADHPRFMGALFVMLVLLSQAGTAVAGNNSGIAGP